MESTFGVTLPLNGCDQTPCNTTHHRVSSLCLFQLPDEEKTPVAAETEKLVALCQQLQAGAKTPAQGKTATFQKVWELHPCAVMNNSTDAFFFSNLIVALLIILNIKMLVIGRKGQGIIDIGKNV